MTGMFDWFGKRAKSEDDAIDASRQALRIDPKDVKVWYSLGVVYDDLDRHDDAIAAYRQVVRINPEAADAWYSLGLAYATLDRHDDAIAAYRQVCPYQPGGCRRLVQPRARVRHPRSPR